MSYSEKSPRGRGVPGRNCALQWLLDDNITEGVFYFADDDNAYDARIFNEVTHHKAKPSKTQITLSFAVTLL